MTDGSPMSGPVSGLVPGPVTVRVCVMVPSGAWDLAPFAQAMRQHHPEWSLGAVWGGDPHRRPVAAAMPWVDLDLTEPTGAGWGRLLVGLTGRRYEWARASAAAGRLLDGGASAVIVLRMGSVAVLGPCPALLVDAPVGLVRRVAGALADDGSAPSEHDLLSSGGVSESIAMFTGEGRAALGWLSAQVSAVSPGGRDRMGDADGDDRVGPLLERMGALFGASDVDPDQVAAPAWGWVAGSRPAVVDLDELDRARPWFFAFAGGSARVRLSAHPDLAALVRATDEQRSGRPEPVVLPGAVAIDESIRSLMAGALAEWHSDGTALPPEPFGADHSGFVRWLEEPGSVWGADVGRYWTELLDHRADLRAVFPRPGSVDQDRFVEWTKVSWRLEQRSVLIASRSTPARDHVESTGRNTNGINVTGYLDTESGLGDVARRINAALSDAHVPHDAVAYHRTTSPSIGGASTATGAGVARYGTNLVVLSPDQFHFFVADHGATLLDGRRTIAYWFWELDEVPPTMLAAIDQVDEIWAGSRFVADAFARVTDKPVRCVPIPVAEPVSSGKTRDDFGLPDERPLLLVTFDHFSVTERKNPFGAIEAFRRAFPEPSVDGPVLVVKTMNGDRRWQNHERVLLAAAGRDDMIVIDEHLDRADQMALLDCCDVLVSLHRSEGLGLHCAEAMWFAKPVIATRYSGNLDFMDDSCSALVDAELVPVAFGEGVYPATARWADPDLDQAADWMRRLVTDSALALRLGTAARRRMASQPSLATTGRTIARLAALGPYHPEPVGKERS